MKTYVYSDNALKALQRAEETLSYMVDSGDYDITDMNSQFDRIDDIRSKFYNVDAEIKKSLITSMKVPFPQFEMLYTIDYDNDIIKRGNGTVINETNSTVVEKTLLHLFQAIIKEADDYDASLDEVLDGYRAEMLED
jgi:hypothetical protein